MSNLKNKIATYEVQDYDARDLIDHLDEELNFNEINNYLSKLELEIDFKQYPALNTFLYSIAEIEKELKAIKEYVNE